MRGANIVKLLKTIDLISSHRGATVEQIADELEVSKRSAYRLLGIVEELGFLVEDIKDKLTDAMLANQTCPVSYYYFHVGA